MLEVQESADARSIALALVACVCLHLYAINSRRDKNARDGFTSLCQIETKKPSLKTIPKGYDRNHPQAHLLRLKDYGKFHPCNEAFFSDPSWPEHASELFSILKPLVDFLNYSVEEE